VDKDEGPSGKGRKAQVEKDEGPEADALLSILIVASYLIQFFFFVSEAPVEKDERPKWKRMKVLVKITSSGIRASALDTGPILSNFFSL